MICRLTPVKHNDIRDIEDLIIPPNNTKPDFKGSYVRIWLEPNQYANERKGEKLAVRVDFKGCKLGYVPELSSVTEWKGEHDEWTKAVEAVRNQLFLEYDHNGTTEWGGHVAACRYIQKVDGLTRYITNKEFFDLTVEEQNKWKLEQVAILFPVEGE